MQTADKHYIEGSRFSEEFFRGCDGKYVVLRKVTDSVSYTSQVEPRVQDIWPVFELYDRIFDTCPTQDELKDIPAADMTKHPSYIWRFENYPTCKGTFYCEGSMFYFRKRNYVLIGKNTENLPNQYNDLLMPLGYNHVFGNADSEIIDCIIKYNNVHMGYNHMYGNPDSEFLDHIIK